jgi:hypothetical protein
MIISYLKQHTSMVPVWCIEKTKERNNGGNGDLSIKYQKHKNIMK